MSERLINRNAATLEDFTKFCATHPEQRFWQALRNWADVRFIFMRTEGDHMKGNLLDTFHREGK